MDGVEQKRDGSGYSSRPRAYEQHSYPWNLHHVPPHIEVEGGVEKHPGRRCAIFVVHGIGDQSSMQTAAALRSGFDDTLDLIEQWQGEHPAKSGEEALISAHDLPPPFIYDGYWANYPDLAATFPEDWQRFHERERTFFGHLWQRRTSLASTYLWCMKNQLRLLHPRLIKQVKFYYLLYWPLQAISLLALLYGVVRHPKVLTHFLADVRFYLEPKGVTEKAVVQRIDYRVGSAFLSMIGLDWDFNPLDEAQRIEVSGEHVTFDRIVWVAHSLGTVISYNVLSDLFQRAAELDAAGTPLQKQGVKIFRESLRRFITLGSPLDKVAFLFPQALRPWPAVPRKDLLPGGESYEIDDGDGQNEIADEWWINFYSTFDPISGSLGSPLICHAAPPLNMHSGFSLSDLLPGLAHVNYWQDTKHSQRFILGRTYGKRFLRDRVFRPHLLRARLCLVVGGYFFWLGLLLGGIAAVIRWWPDVWQFARDSVMGAI